MRGLKLEAGCIHGLKWRIQLAPDEDLVLLLHRSLIRAGASDLPTPFFPSVLSVAMDLHELVLVPRTGRIQLRIHYTVPREERRAAAVRLAELVETEYAHILASYNREPESGAYELKSAE